MKAVVSLAQIERAYTLLALRPSALQRRSVYLFGGFFFSPPFHFFFRISYLAAQRATVPLPVRLAPSAAFFTAAVDG